MGGKSERLKFGRRFTKINLLTAFTKCFPAVTSSSSLKFDVHTRAHLYTSVYKWRYTGGGGGGGGERFSGMRFNSEGLY
jgi:hypothetical protein